MRAARALRFPDTGTISTSTSSLEARPINRSRQLGSWVKRLSPRQLFLLVFAMAWVVRLAGVFASGQYLDLGRYELERTAISLAQTGVYGNAYALPTGPSAHVSPGYTLILAALFKIFGTGVFAEIVKQTLASAVSAFQCALLIPVARGLLLDARAGLLSAIFAALLPMKFGTETMGDWEAPYTAIALMLVSVLMARVYRSRDFSLRRGALTGLAWGASLLFASVLLPMFAIFMLIGLFIAGRGERLAYLRFCLIQAVVMGGCLAPWVIRNSYALGAPVVTRTNFGLELRVSNNDLATGDEHLNSLRGVYQIYHPLQNKREALELRRMGEIAYNKQAEQQALTWIRAHPGRFLDLAVQRARLFWFYVDRPLSPLQRIKYTALGLIHVAGLVGLIYLFRSNRTSAIVLSIILAIYPLPNYLVHLGPRQSYPLDWIVTLLTFTLLVRFGDLMYRPRHRGERLQEQSPALAQSEAVLAPTRFSQTPN